MCMGNFEVVAGSVCRAERVNLINEEACLTDCLTDMYARPTHAAPLPAHFARLMFKAKLLTHLPLIQPFYTCSICVCQHLSV